MRTGIEAEPLPGFINVFKFIDRDLEFWQILERKILNKLEPSLPCGHCGLYGDLGEADRQERA